MSAAEEVKKYNIPPFLLTEISEQTTSISLNYTGLSDEAFTMPPLRLAILLNDEETNQKY